MKTTTIKRYRTLSIAVITAALLLTGCGTNGTPAKETAPGGSSSAPPAASGSAQQGRSDSQSEGTAPPAAAKPEPGNSQAKPAQDPMKLADMHFINEKQGWTAAETKQGTDIWRTADGGTAWSKAQVPGLFVRGLGFANGSEGWAAGKSDCREEQGQRRCSRLQIAHTKDGGANWSMQWQQQGQDVDYYGEDRIFALNDRQVFAISGHSMLSTADGGGHWNPVNFHIGPFLPEQASFDRDGKHGWVLGRAGKGCKPDDQTAGEQCAITVVNTVDGGNHWDLQWSPQDSSNLRNVGISFINPKKGWMLILSNDTLQSTLYGTTDAGAHWSKISEMRGGRPYTRGLQFVSDSTGFVPLSAGAGPIGGGLAITRDGGKQFERKVEEGQEWSFEQLQFFSEKDGWIRVSDPAKGDYLMYTADVGNSWKSITPGTGAASSGGK